MNIFIVFGAIRQHCTGSSNIIRLTELESLAGNTHSPFLYSYIEVLESLGLITFSNYYSQEIALTEKGRSTPMLAAGFRLKALLAIHVLRQFFFFVLFWPLLFTIRQPYAADKSADSRSGSIHI